MAFKIKLSTKQKRRAWQKYQWQLSYQQHIQRYTQGGSMALRDADQPETQPDKPNEQIPPEMQKVTMSFLCPAGFTPAVHFIVAMDQHGNHFTNAPVHLPHLCLRLATLGLDFASQQAVLHMQAELKKQSPILTVPAGTIPPWVGPAGRG